MTFMDNWHVAVVSCRFLLLLRSLVNLNPLDPWELPRNKATSLWHALEAREAFPLKMLASWGRWLAARRAQTSSASPLSPPWIWNEGMWGFLLDWQSRPAASQLTWCPKNDNARISDSRQIDYWYFGEKVPWEIKGEGAAFIQFESWLYFWFDHKYRESSQDGKCNVFLQTVHR